MPQVQTSPRPHDGIRPLWCEFPRRCVGPVRAPLLRPDAVQVVTQPLWPVAGQLVLLHAVEQLLLLGVVRLLEQGAQRVDDQVLIAWQVSLRCCA